MLRGLSAVAVLLLAFGAAASNVGDKAPELEGIEWINLGRGKKPKLKGKTVVLVFWATNNLQGTMAMTGLQNLHEHFTGYGLAVVTVSFEEPKKLQPFVEDNDYTVAVGSDFARKVSSAYGVRGWPQAFLIDKKGKVVWKGDPFRVVQEARKLAGVGTEPQELLTRLVSATRAKKKPEIRRACDLLVARSPVRFDLKKWAAGLDGASAPAGAEVPKLEPEEALTAHVEGRPLALDSLRAAAPEQFDLAGWSRRRQAALFPLTSSELKVLLRDRRYTSALDALALRGATSSLAGSGKRDKGFSRYCAKRSKQRLSVARKTLMLYHWPIAGRTPRDNDAFWRELSLKAWLTDEDRKMNGARLGGRDVYGTEMPEFADRCVTQHFIMEAVAGRASLPSDLPARVAAERKRILADLKARYD